MSNLQVIFSRVGLFLAIASLNLGLATILKHYIDAKIDPMQSQIKQLVDYMILHEGKIATLEKRIKH